MLCELDGCSIVEVWIELVDELVVLDHLVGRMRSETQHAWFPLHLHDHVGPIGWTSSSVSVPRDFETTVRSLVFLVEPPSRAHVPSHVVVLRPSRTENSRMIVAMLQISTNAAISTALAALWCAMASTGANNVDEVHIHIPGT